MAARPGRCLLSRPRLTRIVILGAGSIGCFVGGCWQAKGLDVTFIGRPALASDIATHGLIVSEGNAGTKLDRVDFRTDPAALADADIIALCVKSGGTEAAAGEIANHGRDGATVLSLQNGISNIDVLGRVLGQRFAIVRGMVPFNVAYLGEGEFHKGVAGQIHAEDVPVMRALAARVGQSPAGLVLHSDMLSVAWGKLLINLNNAVNALSGRTLIDQLSERDYRRVVAAAMREGLGLLAKAGIEPAKAGPVPPSMLPAVIGSPDWLFNNLFLKIQKIDAKARSSMADDLAAGRTTEVDYINGELVALANQLGVDAPINRTIVSLIRKAEAGAPSWASAALREAVLGR